MIQRFSGDYLIDFKNHLTQIFMEGVRNVLLASLNDMMEDMEETEYFLTS